MIFLAIMNHYKARLPQDHTMLLTSLQGQGKIARGAGLATREGEIHSHAVRKRDRIKAVIFFVLTAILATVAGLIYSAFSPPTT